MWLRFLLVMLMVGWGVLPVHLARAQSDSSDWLARDWQSDDGLPDNGVTGIAQTADGFLWIGTAGGLMRFDGIRFLEWPVASLPGVPNRVVRALSLDEKGQLWVAMDRGPIVLLEPEGAKVFTEGLPDSRVLCMATDAKGATWIAYGNETMAVLKDGRLTRIGAEQGLMGSGLCLVTTDNRGQVWISKGSQVGLVREDGLVTLTNLPRQVQGIGPCRLGGIWICAGDRLLLLQADGRLEERGVGVPEADTLEQKVLLEDHTGAIWVGTSANGLSRYENSRWRLVGTSHHTITCLMEDMEGNVWAGTLGAGFNRLRPRTVELITTESGLPFESVRSVCEDPAGTIWITTQNGLLANLRKGAWTVASRETGWPGGLPTCVTADQRGDVWVGTAEHGLYRWSENEWSVIGPGSQGLADGRIRSLLPTSSGDLFVATDEPQIQRWRGGRFENVTLPTASRTIRAMAEGTNGVVWAGTADGQLFRIVGDRVENLAPKISDRLLSIRGLCATPDGCLWIGFAGWGVGRLKGDDFVRITTAEGLHDDYISQLAYDRNEWLWCAGNRGLFQVRLGALADVAEGRATHVRSIIHGRGEGLYNLQPNYEYVPASLRGGDGRIWFAMRTGLAVVNPDNSPRNTVAPSVLLDRVMVDGEAVALYDSKSPVRSTNTTRLVDLRRDNPVVRLQPSHRKIDIDFAALSYVAPENVRIQYRLGGVDEDWGTVESDLPRSVTYSRLPDGEYQFEVKACNNDGIWNEAGTSLTFVVTPFFYNTWWFHMLMLGTFTAGVIGLVRYVSFRRLRAQLQVLEQQNALHHERARIAKDIHDDLGASLTQIAFMGELAQQDSADAAKAAERTERISVTARQAIKSLDEIVWAVNPRNDTLAHLIDYVGQHALDFLRIASIRCRLDLPDSVPQQEVPTDIRHNLFLAVKEALTNIVKHAHATEVRLRISLSKEAIEVAIKDNGRGFKGRPSDPGSDGLRNMVHRMAAIGGVCRIEGQPGEGTVITFQAPWSRRSARSEPG
jgi:signal transduction histidine kinase/ligand-binding sensor domain-containing protein